MKTKLCAVLFLSLSLQLNAINVTIVESLTGNWWAVQDKIWDSIAVELGYNTTIVPQSALDNLSNLASTDVLIVSSGTISFNGTSHLETIIKFVRSGRPVYIQSEYLDTFQGNITFKAIMDNIGVDFEWTEAVAGDLIPMNILGMLGSVPNDIPTLNYFNYGYAGSGQGVESFLEYNGQYFGFCYVDHKSGNGTVITISDEDWAWRNESPELMENILHKLANSVVTSNQDPASGLFTLRVFPNPSRNDVIVETDQLLQKAALTVFNSSGQAVKVIQNIHTQSILIRCDHLPAGPYSIRLDQGGSILATAKLLIADR